MTCVIIVAIVGPLIVLVTDLENMAMIAVLNISKASQSMNIIFKGLLCIGLLVFLFDVAHDNA